MTELVERIENGETGDLVYDRETRGMIMKWLTNFHLAHLAHSYMPYESLEVCKKLHNELLSGCDVDLFIQRNGCHVEIRINHLCSVPEFRGESKELSASWFSAIIKAVDSGVLK